VSLLFAHAVGRRDEDIDLAASALLYAEREYEGLDVAQYVDRLDEIAVLARRRGAGVAAVRSVLFDELGFRGNSAAYSDPKNSFLNDVLDRKLGIPITLSVIFLEVCWRMGLDAYGIGYPGHFLVRAEGQILDPFHGGRERDPATLVTDGLAPVGKRAILTRMLGNLRALEPRRPWVDELLAALSRPPKMGARG
jgi:regulator of sirC expression with transglutaminase-like and TPR domain